MISLNDQQLARLEQAVAHVDSDSINAYLRLKALLHHTETTDHAEFQHLFTQYYRLNVGGLTEAFKQRYFELLFALDPNQADPYTPLLLELYEFPRLQGDRALQFSFVSKLVALYDESRPIYDRQVSNFFGFSAPSTGSVAFRIAGFVANLNILRDTYLAWIEDSRLQAALNSMSETHVGLRACHRVRVCDFLVWTVGKQEIE